MPYLSVDSNYRISRDGLRYKSHDKQTFYQQIQKELYSQLTSRLASVNCPSLDAAVSFLDSHQLTNHIALAELFAELTRLLELKKSLFSQTNLTASLKMDWKTLYRWSCSKGLYGYRRPTLAGEPVGHDSDRWDQAWSTNSRCNTQCPVSWAKVKKSRPSFWFSHRLWSTQIILFLT